MNNRRRPYCVVRDTKIEKRTHIMNTTAAQKTISDIAHETLDFSILEGKTSGLSEQAMKSIAKALMEAYSAGYQAHQQRK